MDLNDIHIPEMRYFSITTKKKKHIHMPYLSKARSDYVQDNSSIRFEIESLFQIWVKCQVPDTHKKKDWN